MPTPDFTIDVNFNTTQETFSFSGSGGSSGDVSPDLDTGTKIIDFVLGTPTTCTFVGIKIGRDQGTVCDQPGSGDTQGNFYPGTCFKVDILPSGSTQSRILRLTDIDRPGQDDSGAWFYVLGVCYDGKEYWPDPRITNLGGDNHMLPPGVYYAGERY